MCPATVSPLPHLSLTLPTRLHRQRKGVLRLVFSLVLFFLVGRHHVDLLLAHTTHHRERVVDVTSLLLLFLCRFFLDLLCRGNGSSLGFGLCCAQLRVSLLRRFLLCRGTRLCLSILSPSFACRFATERREILSHVA